MFLTDDVLRNEWNDSSQTWRVPVRLLTSVEADVAERWMVTARLPLRRFRELVPVPFLEARLVDGSLVLLLSALRMRHAAPLWVPLDLGPPSMNCALHIPCVDVRDGRPCTWVGGRYTDHALAPALAGLGFPGVDGGLVDRGGPGRLDLSAADGLVEVVAGPGGGSDPELFADATALGLAVAAAARSYAYGRNPGRFAMVDLLKLGGDVFTGCSGWEGWLRTPWGDCTIDGVYLARDGRYRWTGQGEVDGHAL